MAAQETLTMFLTSGGTTFSVGVALETVEAWIRTKALDFDQIRFAKFVEQIQASITDRSDATNLNLEIYTSDDENGPFVLKQTIPLTSNDPVNPDVDGARFFKLRFVDSGVTRHWRLHAFEIWGELQGDEF